MRKSKIGQARNPRQKPTNTDRRSRELDSPGAKSRLGQRPSVTGKAGGLEDEASARSRRMTVATPPPSDPPSKPTGKGSPGMHL